MHEERRRELHQKLDEILDRRSRIEPPLGALSAFVPRSPSSHVTDFEEAAKIWRTAISFLGDVLGEPLRAAGPRRLYSNGSEQRAVLRSWLTDLYPLLFSRHTQSALSIAPHHELTVFDVVDAISALDAGEIRPIFLANTGKNRRANRWSLARAKLEALVWKRRLRALGYAEKSASFEVTIAFGEQWDTIRKWKSQCEQILGRTHVSSSLDYAGSEEDLYVKPRAGLFGAVNSLLPVPLEALKLAGSAYRAELSRSAELTKRKPPVG